MSASLSSVSHSSLAGAAPLWTRLTGFIAALAHEWRLRRDLACIQELGPRELADIGIGPGGEEGAVRHGRRWVQLKASAIRSAGCDGSPAMVSSWTEWR